MNFLGKLNAWWAIISNIVKCWPVFPTLSMSKNRTHGWLSANGFAGGLASPLMTHGWNGYTLAWTKKTSSRQRATIGDRKSTRLNSSHLVISYAVFCLKKKKKK